MGDLSLTLINGMGVMLGVFLLAGFIARDMGIEALGTYLLIRRTSLTMMGIVLLGLNTGLPFYISRKGEQAYGTASLLIFAMLCIPLIALVSGVLHSGTLSGYPRDLALPYFVFTVGYGLQQLAFGLFRGQFNMLGANLVHIIGTGLIPIGIFVLLPNRSLSTLLIAMGLGTFIFSGGAYFAKMGWKFFRVGGDKPKQLLSYGLQRLPSAVAYFILLGSVPLLILGETSKANIAYVNSGISLMRVILVGASPLGILLLPRISKALAEGRKSHITQGLDVLTKAVILVGALVAIFLIMHSSALLRLWLGSGGEAGARVVQVIVLALPFYVLMEVLRAPIDAASARGYTSIVYGTAALSLLIVFYGLRATGLDALSAGVISFVVAHVTGAAGSLFLAFKFYDINTLNVRYLATVLVMLGIATVLLHAIQSVLVGPAALLVGGAALVVMLGLYFAASKSDWVVGFRSLVAAR